MVPLDTKPLDAAGVSYASIKKLEALNITAEEIPEVVKMRSAGFPDDACVSIVQIFHQRGKPFDAGEAVAGLYQASVSEDTILELANLNQLGISAGEFQVMRLAGLSDAIILETAKHQAARQADVDGTVAWEIEKFRSSRSYASYVGAARCSRLCGGRNHCSAQATRDGRGDSSQVQRIIALV